MARMGFRSVHTTDGLSKNSTQGYDAQFGFLKDRKTQNMKETALAGFKDASTKGHCVRENVRTIFNHSTSFGLQTHA